VTTVVIYNFRGGITDGQGYPNNCRNLKNAEVAS
jgi:hypothetical protein